MMFSCRQMTELVTEYLEGTMPLLDRIRFRLHAGMCVHCGRYLDQMQRTVAELGRIPCEPVPADVQEGLLELFRDWKR